jgi:hypothetical protein
MSTDKPTCTCPSGDGSLRWPCPAHPSQEAKPAPADLAQTIRGITEGYRGTDCGKCAESIGDRLIDVLAAPAAPALEPLSNEQIKRMKPVCADFVSFRAGVRAMETIAASKGEQA